MRCIKLKLRKRVSQHIVYLDVGSSGGLKRELFYFLEGGESSTIIKVDPASEWGSQDLRFKNTKVLTVPHALSDKNENCFIKITKHPGCSSILEPNETVLSKYLCKSWFEVIGLETIAAVPYCEIAEKLKLPKANFAKLDVQGYELNVLRGLGDKINDLIGVEVEVQFSEIYKGQALFQEVNQYLSSKGLILVGLQPQGAFGPEIVEANAFYIRRPSKACQIKMLKAWIYANNINLLPEIPELRILKPEGILE